MTAARNLGDRFADHVMIIGRDGTTFNTDTNGSYYPDPTNQKGETQVAADSVMLPATNREAWIYFVDVSGGAVAESLIIRLQNHDGTRTYYLRLQGFPTAASAAAGQAVYPIHIPAGQGFRVTISGHTSSLYGINLGYSYSGPTKHSNDNEDFPVGA